MQSPPEPTEPLRLDGAFARRTREDWRAAAEASLPGGETLEGLAHRTLDGLSLDVLHDDSPLEGRWVPPPSSGAEGAAAADRPQRELPSRLRVLGADATAANAHARAGLEGGVGSLELSVGPAALPLEALDAALDGVHLDMVTVSLRAGEAMPAALEALLALYRSRGHDPANVRVELDADPLGALARDGRIADGLGAAYERLASTSVRAVAELPLARVAAIDTVVHHEAGASVVQELIAGIASATLALEHLLDAGLGPATARERIAFRVSCDANLLDGVVKLRALERLWRHVLGECALPIAPPFVIVETSRRHLSRLAPWVNHLRNVVAGTAAAIGDADELLVHPHDLVDGRRLGDDPAIADRVARNLPLLLAEECGLRDVGDAAGGAHAIESLTQRTAEAVWDGLGELQERGGLGVALASGKWQAALARTHSARLRRLREGDAVRVGVNRYRPADAPPSAEPPPAENPPTTAPTDVPDPRAVSRAAPLRAVREAEAFESEAPAEAEA